MSNVLSTVGGWFGSIPAFFKACWKPFIWLGLQVSVYAVWIASAVKSGFQAFKACGFPVTA